jgi:hypothetical protein
MFSVLNNKVLSSVLAMLATDVLATYCPSMTPITVGNYDSRGKFVVGTEGVMKNCNYCKTGVETLQVCIQSGFGLAGASYANFTFRDG